MDQRCPTVIFLAHLTLIFPASQKCRESIGAKAGLFTSVRQSRQGSIAEQTLRTPSIVPLAFIILVHLAHTFLGFGSTETSDKKDRKKFTSMRREDWKPRRDILVERQLMNRRFPQANRLPHTIEAKFQATIWL